MLEKVQRIHLQRPRNPQFKDGEYFDLTNYVRDNTDSQFCLILEIAERARERKIEQLEALNPIPPDQAGGLLRTNTGPMLNLPLLLRASA